MFLVLFGEFVVVVSLFMDLNWSVPTTVDSSLVHFIIHFVCSSLMDKGIAILVLYNQINFSGK